MMLRGQNFGDLKSYLESGRKDPFLLYCVLLYKPVNGLHAKLHEYVADQWRYLDALTGRTCLMLAIENPHGTTAIRNFRPQDVYEVARYLGAPADALPCMVFFTEPDTRRDTLVIRLRSILPDEKRLTNEDLTAFFEHLAVTLDACASRGDDRLVCLRRRLRVQRGIGISLLAREGWSVRKYLIVSVTSAGTLAAALDSIAQLLQHIASH
jgi:hypothetical protein